MAAMNTVAVVGNPKPRSRTLEAAGIVVEELTGALPQAVVDVIDLGAGLLGWGDPTVVAAVELVASADLVVWACPTYKATYTGVLKLFLDQFPANGLGGTVGVPLMLGAGPAHAMAPDLLLKPVLVELGATCPTRGLYLLDSTYTDRDGYATWTATARQQVANAFGSVTA
jgi:FMN reductase